MRSTDLSALRWHLAALRWVVAKARLLVGSLVGLVPRVAGWLFFLLTIVGRFLFCGSGVGYTVSRQLSDDAVVELFLVVDEHGRCHII